VIVGSEASGLFASGVASSLGQRVLLLDTQEHLGGDCTNAACVPSKAVRSVARMRRNSVPIRDFEVDRRNHDHGKDWLRRARQHAADTVSAVRKREDPVAMAAYKNLDLLLCKDCRFTSNQEMDIQPRNETETLRIRSKKFLIATGASPILPESFVTQAKVANVPIFTYRTILYPEKDSSKPSIWNLLDDNERISQIVIAGGGPTACELGQALARLGGKDWNITIIAPGLLLSEDVSLQQAAMQLLTDDGAKLQLGKRLMGVTADGMVELDDKSTLPVDALVLCLGRNPSIANLDLDMAGVDWTQDDGILVHHSTLQSISNTHVYACGDCCSAVKGKARTAAHAAWTGYHAARNIAVPWILRVGAKSVHASVPSVIFSDPEMASVGLSKVECIRKYGSKGFACLSVSEQGTDRGDMDQLERNTNITFVELRATKTTGRILGLTACGPSAAELANEVGVAIVNDLTVQDMARSIHAYPSHGYLLYRLSLSLATGSLWGLLESFGPVGRTIGTLGRQVSRVPDIFQSLLPWKRWYCRKLKEWEANGEVKSVVIDEGRKLISFLELFNTSPDLQYNVTQKEFFDWVKLRP